MKIVLFYLHKKRSITTLIFYLITLALTFLYTYLNVDNTLIDLLDETLYLANRNTPIATWSPIYSIFYRFLNLFSENELKLYDLSFFVVSGILVPSALFLYLKRLGFHAAYCTLATVSISLTKVFIVSTPRVHNFNFSIVLLLFVFLYNNKNSYSKFLFFIIFGMTIYIRVENVFCAFAFALMLFASNIKKDNAKETLKNFVLNIGLFILGAFTTVCIWGFPFDERIKLAFVDHYIWRNPETTDNYITFFNKFPMSTSLKDFALNYPWDFLKHIINNLIDVPSKITEGLEISSFTFDIFPSFVSSSGTLALLILLLTLAFQIPCVWVNRSQRQSLIFFLLAFSGQNLLIACILQPWVKYLPAIIFFVFIVSTTWVLFLLQRKFPIVGLVIRKIRFAAFGLMATLLLKNFTYHDLKFFEVYNSSRELLQFLTKSKMLKDNDHFLTLDFLSNYAANKSNNIKPYIINSYASSIDSTPVFSDYLNDNRINIFCYLDSQITHGILVYNKGLDSVKLFIDNHRTHGYELHSYPIGEKKLVCFRRNFF